MPRQTRSVKHWIQDYFQFSKWQRRAVLLLVLIIIACLGLQAWWKQQSAVAFEQAPKVVLRQVEELAAFVPDSNQANEAPTASWREPASTNQKPVAYFAFDPNTASEQELLRLGMPVKAVKSLLKYRSKGGRLRQPEDLLKIYSLPKSTAMALLPWVRIAPMPDNKTFANNRDSFAHRPAKPAPAAVDINLGDTTAFIALPGIGSRLAARIVNFRDKLGGFYSINQVAETFALPDSTFQKIRSRLVLSSGPYRRLNINTATVEELKAHPYIKWNVANAIVQYRNQHGPYRSLQDLRNIALVDEQWLEKVLPYFTQ
jgi:competence ComEA-like helix-hairpin-helix protein